MSIGKVLSATTKILAKDAKYFSKTSSKVAKCKLPEKYFSKSLNVEKINVPEKYFDIKMPEKTIARRTLEKGDSFLKQLDGGKIGMEVPAEQILKDIPKAQRKAVTDLLGNPETIQFAAKHNKKGNFSILGILGKKGDKTVGKGALSITNFGKPDAVMKYKISTGVKGRNLQANGFVDCAQTAAPQEVSVIPSFIKKMLGLDTRVGKAAASHIQVNPTKAAKLIPDGKLGNIANMEALSQAKIDKLLKTARQNIGNLS